MRGFLVTLVLAVVLISGGGCASLKITADPVYFPLPPAHPRVVHIKSFNGLRELVPPGKRRLRIFGGEAVGPFVGVPAGIAYHAGHLYICDTQINAVHDWDLATGGGRVLHPTGRAALDNPVAVAVDAGGRIYVADSGRAQVVALEADGRCVWRARPPGREACKPTALAVHGGRLYVTDIVSHQIDVYSTQDGKHLDSFGAIGSEPGRMYFPMGLAVGADQRLLVADMLNARVQVFDVLLPQMHGGDPNANVSEPLSPQHSALSTQHSPPSPQSSVVSPDPLLQPLLSFGRPGNRYGDMGKPRHLAVGPQGTIFIADAEFAHVHMFDATGRLLMLFGGVEDEPGGTPMPVGVAVARTLPEPVAALVPADFAASYYVFVTNTIGRKRISLFAVK